MATQNKDYITQLGMAMETKLQSMRYEKVCPSAKEHDFLFIFPLLIG